jgi:acetyltransferase-like isoleucine patch superfamily enzyme
VIGWMHADVEQIEAGVHADRMRQLKSRLQSCGSGVSIGRQPQINSARMLCLGNNVHLGDNARLDARGGLTVGDHTHVGSNVVIDTVVRNVQGRALPYDDSVCLAPVWIGRNVLIGSDVRILPGVTIGEGAIIHTGATVTEDVPDLGIIEPVPSRLTGFRNSEHYGQLVAQERFGDGQGVPLSATALQAARRNACQKGPQIFFAVSTGRSGSTALADALSQHPEITCLHEPRWNLIPLSTNYEHGTISRQEAEAALRRLYCDSSGIPEGTYGESDLKLGNLVEILADMLPEAKFLWLIRDGRDVVASFLARRWYEPDLLELPADYDEPDTRNYWDTHPLSGALCGNVIQQEWDAMTAHEKNCWYWQYWNTRIEQQFARLPPERTLLVRLEELQERIAEVQQFVGVTPLPLEVPRSNAVRPEDQHRLKAWERWTKDQQAVFERRCGAGMDRWYPGWRTPAGTAAEAPCPVLTSGKPS